MVKNAVYFKVTSIIKDMQIHIYIYTRRHAHTQTHTLTNTRNWHQVYMWQMASIQRGRFQTPTITKEIHFYLFYLNFAKHCNRIWSSLRCSSFAAWNKHYCLLELISLTLLIKDIWEKQHSGTNRWLTVGPIHCCGNPFLPLSAAKTLHRLIHPDRYGQQKKNVHIFFLIN